MPVRLDRGALDHLFFDPVQPVQRHLRRLAQDTRDLARNRVGIRSGRLANSLDFNPIGRGEWSVSSDLPYAQVHHEGARVHRIRANRANALHFFWENQGGIETFVPRRATGRTFVARRIGSAPVLIIGKGFVNHPGHPANRYLLDALTLVVRGQIGGGP